MNSLLMDKVKAQFVDYSTEHYLAWQEGDNKTANRLNNKLINLYKKVKESEEQSIFVDFLNHKNEGVKLFSAVFLLKTNHELAIDCLNKLVELPGIISSQAKMTLYLWDRDELDLL